MISVEDVMVKDVISLTIPATVNEALEKMQKFKKPDLPVINKDKELVGIISLEDIIKNPNEDQIALIMSRDFKSVKEGDDIKKVAKILLDNKLSRVPVISNGRLSGVVAVRDIVMNGISKLELTEPCQKYMKEEVPCIWQDTPLRSALMIMVYSKSSFFMVVGNDGGIVGIIDTQDVMSSGEFLDELKTTELNISGEGDDWAWEPKNALHIVSKKLTLPLKPVKDVMSTELVTVTRKTPVNKCAKEMKKNNIEQIPVINAEGGLIGIVRDIDIIKALL
ncbi:MAG: Inosine-5'-monophosphate dehydrogenase [Candidatus Methanofastidiosum methylothiophilum]|uniref:Inosine-5'-monophosphate dehydrogenase n=1 Tax=Candidatus Methanofastidiosum methylothiophilum TaxID=1705564 RepID=A0A150J8I5_9EURY|nr:MAG: Inosine-5'-monophosphate dehydrogenase [Candidatus Methanofastidiosum methylthiophilus]NMC76244.1 CBS domain-containing protein [Candidatus Methanofastidiosa archaeon]